MRLALPILFGLIGTCILVGLGVWQFQRLGEKSAQIGRIEAQLALPPVALPITPNEAIDNYRSVRLIGTILPEELHVLTSTRGGGPGFRVISTFVTAGRRRILLDRGFVPEAEKGTPRPVAAVTLDGNLVWPQETDAFTPDPDLAGNIWFARDVEKMALSLSTEPLMVVTRDQVGENAPLPLPVTVNLPNNHLQYAVTWFLLAFVWAAMSIFWILRIRQKA